MRLGRQRGRKRILAPYGSELTPPSKPQADGALVKALVRAWRWQKLLDQGLYGSGTAIPAAERSYVSRILRLALLAPNIVESALSGEFGDRLCLNLVEQPRPPLWDAKRRLLLGPRPIRTEALRRTQWFRCDQDMPRDAFWAASSQPWTCAVEIGRRSFSFAARSSGSAAARPSNRVIPSGRSLSCRTGPMRLIAVRSSGGDLPVRHNPRCARLLARAAWTRVADVRSGTPPATRPVTAR
jgi:hypothetical protein